MAKAEYDLTNSWTLYSALGGQHSHETGTYSAPKLVDENGDATVGRLDTNRIIDSISGMGGVRVISTPVLSLIRSTSAMPPRSEPMPPRGVCRRKPDHQYL